MPNMAKLEQTIAKSLLQIGAVSLRPQQPFTWTSGIQSPIYCDNRLTMSYPEVREQIADGFIALIQEHFPETELIVGTATAGIPHAAWVAQKLALPMVYVRDKAKGHGKENLIEGLIRPGQRAIVIEDLISTGGSSLKAAAALKDAGAEVLAVAAIFTYQLDKAIDAFERHQIPLYTLSNYSALIDMALQQSLINEEELKLLRAWRDHPEGFAVRGSV